MGRIDSTERLKPHEQVLKSISVDQKLYQLILATLGISDSYPDSVEELLQNDRIKLLEQVTHHFTSSHLMALPKLGVKAETKSISGTWTNQDWELVIESKDRYVEELEQAVQNIAPDWLGEEDEIPITILLPRNVLGGESELLGAESHWDFITIDTPNEQSLFTTKTLSTEEKANLAVRLYFTLKFLGLVDTQQSQRNGSRICQELLQAIGIDDQLEYLNKAELKDWIELQKRRIQLEDNQLNTLQAKLRKVQSTRQETEAQYRKHRAKVDEINAKIDELTDQIEALGNEVRPRSIELDNSRAFYYSIPNKTLSALLKKPAADGSAITFPTLTFKEDCPKYTTVCLGQEKKKDPTALIRVATQIRLMLAYLCPMTSGTAITFRVPKRAYSGTRKTMGITSPTLILPQKWADLALGLKQHTQSKSVKAMSDDDYESQGRKAEFVSAIYADYDTKQGELLRVLPTLENSKATEF